MPRSDRFAHVSGLTSQLGVAVRGSTFNRNHAMRLQPQVTCRRPGRPIVFLLAFWRSCGRIGFLAGDAARRLACRCADLCHLRSQHASPLCILIRNFQRQRSGFARRAVFSRAISSTSAALVTRAQAGFTSEYSCISAAKSATRDSWADPGLRRHQRPSLLGQRAAGWPRRNRASRSRTHGRPYCAGKPIAIGQRRAKLTDQCPDGWSISGSGRG